MFHGALLPADIQEFDFEDEGCVRGDGAAGPARSVRQRRRDDELAGSADLHAAYAAIPPLNHLSGPEPKRKGLSAVARAVKLRAVAGQPAGVVDRDRVAFSSGRTAAG